MFFKRSHIVIFFCSSVLTAYVVHLWIKGSPQGFADFASQTPKVLSEKVQKIIDTSDNVKEELKSFGTQMTEPESVQSCQSERIYLESKIASIPPLFRGERAKNSNEFPKVCVTYIMRNSFSEFEDKISPQFIVCEKGTQKKGGNKPCITDSYINTIYNYFGDVTECLGIPQRELLPQFYFESGFQTNLIGKSGEIGVSQLPNVSVKEAEKFLPEVISEVSTSKKPSCQRLLPSLKALPFNLSEKNQLCEIVGSPDQALGNLFYFSVYFRHNRVLIKSGLNDSQLNILGRMRGLGLSSDEVDQEQLIQIMTALSFRSGAKTSLKMLYKYLEFVEDSGKNLQLSDFDLNNHGPFTFQSYLEQHLDSGNKDYLNQLQKAAMELNSVFKEGVCAPDSYLKL